MRSWLIGGVAVVSIVACWGCSKPSGSAAGSGAAAGRGGGQSGGSGAAAGSSPQTTGGTTAGGNGGSAGVAPTAGGPPAAGGTSGAGTGGNGAAGASVAGGSAGDAGSAGSAGAIASTGGTAGSGGAGGGAGGMDETPTLIGDVAFSVPSQCFKGELAVGMTTVSGAEIRYTTDGTLPTAQSTAYAGTPLTLTETTELRAQAFAGGAASGAVSTGLYVARSFDLTSNLPILIVDGYGGGKSSDKELYLNAAVMTFEPVNGTASLGNLPTLATRAGYHLRGQSSSTFEQTPYRLEFRDNADDDADYPLLGMPADGDWALIPPFYDRSLIRNPFTYTLGKDLGLEAPRTAFAEVYVNYQSRPLNESDYLGIYWVSELIKNNEVRTNLKQLKEDDTALPAITGGYIWKFEQLATEEPTLACTGSMPIRDSLSGGAGGGTCWNSLELVDPVPVNAEQKAWITAHIQAFHDALHATPIGDYASFIDLPSFVDYFLVTELSRNMDAYVRSAYYFKDRDGKIEAGPLWDYNFAFGAGSPTVVDPAGGWQVEAGRNVNDWFLKLLADPQFRAAVKARWQVVRQDQFSQASFDQRIATLAAPLTGEAMVRDGAKWPMSFFTERAGRSTVPVTFPMATTLEGQLQALRDYLQARTTRMDALIGAL